MGIRKLSPDDQSSMAEQPEAAMNIHIAKRGDDYVMVVGERIAITYDEQIVSDLSTLNEAVRSTPESGHRDYGRRLESWVGHLETSESVTPIPIDEALSVLGFIHLGPRYLLSSPPLPPGSIYGHLPFHGIANGNDVFYRYEPFPTSRRIDRRTNRVIKPDTFASPALDKAFVNSGLGAVARYALPQLLPACWRYELTPPAGTVVHYGASVPLFGQSGGGVEVSFPTPFQNTGAIPPPYVLPIM